MNKGIGYGVCAYLLWGLFPIYWKSLKHIPSLQLMSHRILWSFLMLVLILLLSRQWKIFCKTVFTLKIIRLYFLAAILIGLNWLTYVWAVTSGFIVETSLGYFINPLLSVSMGVVFLHERLRPTQWFPIGLATVGVLYLTWVYGSLPWIALALAFSFAFYGLIKKMAPLPSLHGLTLETAILFLPSLVYLLYAEKTGQAAFLHTSTSSDLLLIGAGLTTTIPLLLFASAAKRIPLSLVGILQYIAPTLQFLLGVLLYKEPFSSAQFV
ncbi:MAG: EamA family transporter RarD [Planctomycetota bacterium]